MDASSYIARINFRNRWQSYAGVAVLLALTAGLSMFSLAGARRIQSSYPRFLRAANGSTVTIGVVTPNFESKLTALPQVVSAANEVGFNIFLRAPRRATLTTRNVETVGGFESVQQDRFTATSGRVANPARADEFVVNEYAAQRYDLHIGDRFSLDFYATDQVNAPGFFDKMPVATLTQPATLVGIGVSPDEVLQDDADRTARVLITPALSTRAAKFRTYALQGLKLRHGDSDIDGLRQEVDALTHGASYTLRAHSVDTYHALKAVRPLSTALAIFGVITGVAAALLVGLALGTLLRTAAEQRDVLVALGMTRRAITRVIAVGPAISVFVGTFFAVALSFLASPLMPIGPVRRVDPSRGLSLDLTVLGLGAIALLVGLLAFVVVSAWLAATPASGHRRRVHGSRVADAAIAAGVPTPGVAGLRLAFSSADARSAASSRSVLAGTMIAIAALTGALTFGASLDDLVHQPHLYGWNWNAAVIAGTGYDNMKTSSLHRILDADPNVAAWSGAYFATMPIDGVQVPLLAMQPGSLVLPTLLHGRAPSNPTEIVLGAQVARELHKHVDDQVSFGPHRDLTVVGIATFPSIGKLHASHPSLGVGALVAPSLVPDANRDIFGAQRANLGPNVVFVRYKLGTSETSALVRLRSETKPLTGFAGLDVVAAQRPAEIVNAGSTGNAPLLLALSLGIGAVVSLALSLSYAVRRRRRELMVLKTLGFTRGQLAATVWWQASATMVVALAVGIPVGAIGGSALWSTFARALDVLASPRVPAVTVIVLALGALVVANITAVMPARRARRLEPASVLRSE
jgi:hypothetical protein